MRRVIRCCRNALKEAVFIGFLYCGYVQLRDWVLSRRGRSRAVVLYYHRIGGCDSMSRSEDQFRRDLIYLKQHYECISLYELVRRLRACIPMKRPVAVVTFDDGYRDNYLKAVSILQEQDVTAAFFVSTGFVDTDLEFTHDIEMIGKDSQTATRYPKLTWDDLRSMQAAGFEIGSHTINHIDCGMAPASILLPEICGSMDALNRELGAYPRAFSYPCGQPGNISEQATRLIKRTGYYAAVSAYGGTNGLETEPYNIKRMDAGNGNISDLGFRARVTGFFRCIRKKVTVTR